MAQTLTEIDYTYLTNSRQATRIVRDKRGWIIAEDIFGKTVEHAVLNAKDLFELLARNQ